MPRQLRVQTPWGAKAPGLRAMDEGPSRSAQPGEACGAKWARESGVLPLVTSQPGLVPHGVTAGRAQAGLWRSCEPRVPGPPSGRASGSGDGVAAGVGLGPQTAPAGCASFPGSGPGPGEQTLTHIFTVPARSRPQEAGARPSRHRLWAASTCADFPGSGWVLWGKEGLSLVLPGASPAGRGTTEPPGLSWRWGCWCFRLYLEA